MKLEGSAPRTPVHTPVSEPIVIIPEVSGLSWEQLGAAVGVPAGVGLEDEHSMLGIYERLGADARQHYSQGL